jgi:rubrerythrin
MSKDRNRCEVTEIERMAYEMERLFVEAKIKQTLPKKHPSIVKAEALYNAGYRKQKDGRWKGAGLGDYYCSLCCSTYSGGDEYNYCPNCGANMKGGAE